MAHLIGLEEEPKKKTKLFTVQDLNGKVGFSFFVLKKEIFLGISISNVDIETIVRKRTVKVPKAKVKVFKFDSL
jgi:hypothetical protein